MSSGKSLGNIVGGVSLATSNTISSLEPPNISINAWTCLLSGHKSACPSIKSDGKNPQHIGHLNSFWLPTGTVDIDASISLSGILSSIVDVSVDLGSDASIITGLTSASSTSITSTPSSLFPNIFTASSSSLSATEHKYSVIRP